MPDHTSTLYTNIMNVVIPTCISGICFYPGAYCAPGYRIPLIREVRITGYIQTTSGMHQKFSNCRIAISLVRDGRERGSGKMQNIESLESRLATPVAEISSSVVKGISKLDQHIERH